MEILELFGKLTPLVQLALVIGCFGTILLVACNRGAATNLAMFLHEVYRIHRRGQRHQFPLHEGAGRRRRGVAHSAPRRRSRPN